MSLNFQGRNACSMLIIAILLGTSLKIFRLILWLLHPEILVDKIIGVT